MRKSKTTVDYSPGHRSSHCGDDGEYGQPGMCAHYQRPGRCAIVAGDIDPDYWCKEWTRLRQMAGAARHVAVK